MNKNNYLREVLWREGSAAFAQQSQAKSVCVVLPFPPGGGMETLQR